MTTSATSIDLEPLYESALDSLFLEARTASTFSPEPVPAGTLAAIYDLAKMGPTAMNSSPLRVAFVSSDEGKARLLHSVFEGNVAKVTQAPVTAILAVDTEFHERLPELFPHVPAARDRFVGDEAGRIGAAEFNGALQMGYFIMGVRALGLAAGPLGGFDPAGVDAEFFGGTTWRTKLLVNIGKPGTNPWHPRHPRIDASEATLTF